MRRRAVGAAWHAGDIVILFQTVAAPGTAEEAAALVDAVLTASPADELDWIEWKSSLELGRSLCGDSGLPHPGHSKPTAGSWCGQRGWPGIRVSGSRAWESLRVEAADPADLPRHCCLPWAGAADVEDASMTPVMDCRSSW